VELYAAYATNLDGDEAAWLYVLNDYEGGLPSARYLGIVADAGRTGGCPRRLRGRAAREALHVARRLNGGT
jgi:hypothetical protein